MGGGLAGITGDVQGVADIARRQWEQSMFDAGWWGTTWGAWAPFVSEWQARGVPALTASMRLISGVVMQMPLRQKRGDLVVDPPATIIQNPAPGPNRCLADWVDEYVSDILLYGNYAALIGPLDSTGWPAYLIPLDITTVAVARDPNTWQPIYSVEGIDEYVAADRIFHVALDKRSGELAGRGVLPTLAGPINAALAADSYAGRYFTESGVPSGVITDTRPNLTQPQADELKTKWMQAVSGARVPIVVPASTTFQPLASDADKAQLVQARQWDAQVIAMCFGVPPFLLGIESMRQTYTNAETEFGRFLSTTILRIVRPLEQQLSLQCLPRGNNAEFWTGALLRADTATRTASAVSLYQAGIIEKDEARALAGFTAETGSTGFTQPAPAAPATIPDTAGTGTEDQQQSADLHLVGR